MDGHATGSRSLSRLLEIGTMTGYPRGHIGTQRVLGRLAQDESKAKGKNAAWVLEDADDDDIETARDYLRYVTNPLASTKPAKGKKK